MKIQYQVCTWHCTHVPGACMYSSYMYVVVENENVPYIQYQVDRTMAESAIPQQLQRSGQDRSHSDLKPITGPHFVRITFL